MKALLPSCGSLGDTAKRQSTACRLAAVLDGSKICRKGRLAARVRAGAANWLTKHLATNFNHIINLQTFFLISSLVLVFSLIQGGHLVHSLPKFLTGMIVCRTISWFIDLINSMVLFWFNCPVGTSLDSKRSDTIVRPTRRTGGVIRGCKTQNRFAQTSCEEKVGLHECGCLCPPPPPSALINTFFAHGSFTQCLYCMYLIKVEPGSNDIYLCDTSSIASNIPLYQLILHC
jgi:hypothetical protein